jgi:hypothetical protein
MMMKLVVSSNSNQKQAVRAAVMVLIASAWFAVSAAWSIATIRLIEHKEFPRTVTINSYGEFMTVISPVFVAWLCWDLRNHISSWGKVGIALLFASTLLTIVCKYPLINLSTRYVLSFGVHSALLLAGVSGVVEASHWLRSNPIV